ncbi:MAG: molybdopterin cofactor-binding domain-containing protein, partial [Verrucomicrobiota bacterium]
MNPPTSTDGAAAPTPGLSRRNFLVTLSGGLSLGFFLPSGGRMLGAVPAADTPINAWIRIGTDGRATLLYGGSEMGQGAMSGLAQILAEELKVAWSQVVIQQSDANPQVSYTTGGSSAVSRRYTPLRTAGATARELLVASAMGITGDTDRPRYGVANGVVTYTPPAGSPGSWDYGQLAPGATSPAAQALVPNPLPASALTAPEAFQLIGKPLARPDIPPKTNGAAKFGIDVFLPGMVFAAIRHCPTMGGVLAATPAVPSGAIAVVACRASDTRGAMVKDTYHAVAVVANNTWQASKLARALKVTWTLPASTASVDSASLGSQAGQLLLTGQPLLAETSVATTDCLAAEAAVDLAMQAAGPALEATFRLPYLAHATFEPLACTASLTFSSTGTPLTCEVWAPTQAALTVVKTVTAVTGITDTTKIVVHTTFLGGGLGRKIEQDYV